jgi:deoxycytidylate deaminase
MLPISGLGIDNGLLKHPHIQQKVVKSCELLLLRSIERGTTTNMSFRISQKLAKQSSFPQHKLGAVIVKGNRILSTGINSRRSSAIIGTSTLHAEAAAVLKLLKEGRQSDLVGSDIYVSRYTRAGNLGLARPCSDCWTLLSAVGVKRVYYTTSTGVTKMEYIN